MAKKVGARKQNKVRIPRMRRIDVNRDEFDRVAAIVAERAAILSALQHDLDIQFKRIAQLQSELEQLQRRMELAEAKR
jgi:predicted  nucleic acid-binding Zn-ribbon protein